MTNAKHNSATRWLARTAFAVMVASALCMTAGEAFARDCKPTIKPSAAYKGQIEMPPAKYWVKPGRDYKTVSCATMTELYGKGGNSDCHLLGMYIDQQADPLTFVRLMGLGVEPGDVTICAGISGVSKTMVLIHEYAHRHGWQHGQNSHWYSVKAWMADPNVPAWAKE